MFNIQLFLGFPIDQLFAKKLDRVNQNLISEFIKDEGDYLREVQHNGVLYVGKEIGKITEYQKLELLEQNIYSLLKKLVPDFPYDEAPLYLFPMTEDESRI